MAFSDDCVGSFGVAEIDVDGGEGRVDALVGIGVEAHDEFEMLAGQRKLIGLAVEFAELQVTGVTVRIFR